MINELKTAWYIATNKTFRQLYFDLVMCFQILNSEAPVHIRSSARKMIRLIIAKEPLLVYHFDQELLAHPYLL